MDDRLRALGLEPLHLFQRIARYRSLREAAKTLHVSPPALTRALQRLEEGLGTRLCTRGRGGFALTEDGRRVLELADRIGRDAADLLDPASTSRQSILGVGALGGAMVRRVGAALRTTLEAYPEVRLNLTLATSDELDRLVAAGELDVGVGTFDRRRGSLRYVRIGTEPFRYYLSKHHPLWRRRARIGRRDLKGQAVVWVDHERVASHELADSVFRDHPGQQMRVVAFTNDLDGALELLLGGFAIVPMPRDAMAPYLDAGLVAELRVRPRVNQLTTEVVYDPDAPLRPPVDTFLRQLGARG